MISTQVAEYLLKKVGDFAFDQWSKRSPNKQIGAVLSSPEECEAALNDHIHFVSSWCKEISFTDLRVNKDTDQVYIPLNVLLQPRRVRLANEPEVLLPLDEALEQESVKHVVIVGQPGAGKTSSLKHFCLKLFNESDFLADSVRYPVLIQLRELNRTESLAAKGKAFSLFDKLQQVLGLRVAFPYWDRDTDDDKRERLHIRNRALIHYLDSTQALLLLDGFDEISSREQRESLMSEIQDLASQLQSSRLILTSRTGEFEYQVANASQFEISPLSERQILSFSQAWLGESDGRLFLEQIRYSPYADTTIRPLTLAHLCAIYERIKKIPDKPKTVYRKIVSLLLTEWDEQKERGVKRESRYASFEVDRKIDFLAHLAYALTCDGLTRFNKDNLIEIYGKIHQNFSLPINDSVDVARELESHTGLLVRSGYESYEFSHKSLQEFLAAEHLIRLGNMPFETELLLSIPNELAIAVAISSQPSQYISSLALRLRDAKPPFVFMRAFLVRLFLERPDFEVTDRAGVALLNFYSKFLESAASSRDQAVQQRETVLLEELIRTRIPKKAITEIFEEIRSLGIGERRVIMLRHKRAKTALLSEPLLRLLQYELPSTIYVASDLLS